MLKKLIILTFVLGMLTNHSILGQTVKPVIVIHGGAGNMTKETLPDTSKHLRVLREALTAGYTILQNGGSSTDAVVAAISVLEDSPLFNAGRGSVKNSEGKIEMDASIMQAKDFKAGAIASVRHIKNPIQAARKVMDKTKHVLFVGYGAERVAKANGLQLMNEKYFHSTDEKSSKKHASAENEELKARFDKFGTVGCVARDKEGNLSAGTSTGGMEGKMPGRVGDSPIIGAATYADNNTCAISTTGHGEFFIRGVVAYDVCALMDYKSLSLQLAIQTVIEKLNKKGGQGGIIGLSKNGDVSMQFNTPGMFRGYIDADGNIVVKVFAD